MSIVRVNVPLQTSRGIFVYGEIIKMHTIHESNYTVIKLPRNGNSEGKINKNNSVHKSYQAQLMGWMHLIFTQIMHL